MLKKHIVYTDYNGNERAEDHYFNLNESEIADMELSVNGGMMALLNQIVTEQDGAKISSIFKTIIEKSYGKKTLDGRGFEKSEEIFKSFYFTEAYNKLYMELLMEKGAAAKFVNGILPHSFKPKSVETSAPAIETVES